MKQPIFFTAGDTDALRQARNQLLQWGYEVSPAPSDRVTHLLLPVPSFDHPGMIKGNVPLSQILENLPEDVTILGGNLPALPYKCVDFLKDEYYLGENAAITAHCTTKLVQHHCLTLEGANVLVIGWGRIGKRLAALLKAQGASVSVAVRKEAHQETLLQLGYIPVLIPQWNPKDYTIIINTAPAFVLDESETTPAALLVDLASVQGIRGNRVIWARGLPNKDAPDVSGILIAKTALRYALGKE